MFCSLKRKYFYHMMSRIKGENHQVKGLLRVDEPISDVKIFFCSVKS